MSREVDHYELLVEVHGPYFHDRVVLEDPDPRGLEPEFVVCGNALFERYRGEDESSWTDIRAEFVVSRTQRVVYRDRPDRQPIVDAKLPSAMARVGSSSEEER